MYRLQFFIVGLMLSASLNAQTLSIGVKAGPTSSWQTGWCCEEYSSRPGLTGGLTGSLAISRVFGLQAEILFAEKGIRGPAGFVMRQDYLEVPLLVRATRPRGALASPVLLVGVAPALELSCSGVTTQLTLASSESTPHVPLECDSWRTFRGELGLVLAVGLDVPTGRAVWTSELRFTRGLSDLTRGWDYIPQTKNRALVLMFGVRSSER